MSVLLSGLHSGESTSTSSNCSDNDFGLRIPSKPAIQTPTPSTKGDAEPFAAWDVSRPVDATTRGGRLPKFYYKIREGEEVAEVNGGFELPNLETAKREAMLAAVDSLKDRFPASIDLTVELFNEKRDLVSTTHIAFNTEDR
jgi:hypothetical protein